MEYFVGRPKDKAIEKIVPLYNRFQLDREDTFVVYGGSETIVVQLGIFRVKGKVAELIYLFAAEEYRSYNAGRELVLFAQDFLAVMGVEKIVGQAYDDEISGTAEAIGEELTAIGYTKCDRQGYYLEYDLKMLKETVFSKKLDDMENLVNKVAYYNSLSDEALNTLDDEITKAGLVINPNDVDYLFARYYMEGDVIKGFMDWREIEENCLYMAGTYIATGKEQQFYFPAMLAAFVLISENTMPDETKIMFPIFSQGAYNGVKKIFGEAITEKAIYLYEKKGF